MNAILPIQRAHRTVDARVCQVFDDLLQRWIALPHDCVEVRGAHPGLLQLLEWAARPDP
jgi:hypothetical protein